MCTNLRITFAFAIILLLFASCGQKSERTKAIRDLPKDTLRVTTMYGTTSYYYFRDEFMGFDYEMVGDFADFLKLPTKIIVVNNVQEMADLLISGKADIAAYNTIQTKELKKNLNFVFSQPDSYQVLVQRVGKEAITSITQLRGKKVMVRQNSVYHNRLIGINEEIGGGIDIVFASDSVTTEDLVEMVATGTIDYTLAYYNTATLFKTYYPQLDCKIHVGFNQRNGWMINKRSKALRKEIETWENLSTTVDFGKSMYKKYWLKNQQLSNKEIHIPKGSLSPYDTWFKQYSKDSGLDWRLVVAIANSESRFQTDLVSWAGAVGIMQLMPITARKMGLNDEHFFNAELNIKAGVKYINFLEKYFSNVTNKDERIKFVFAAYNSGPAHVLDAIELTKKYGKNPHLWTNNVEYFLLKKDEPEFYQDPVVKYGSFRGNQTVAFVKRTLLTYEGYLSKK